MGIINRDGALWMATGVDNSGLYSGLNQAENRINQFEAHIGKVGDSITRLTGVGLGVAGLKAFSSEIINVRGEMQMLESSFEVLLGGKGVSGFMSEMKQFAVDSPLSMNGVANAAQTLLGFGIAAEKVMPTIKQIGDISMGNEDRFKSLSLAFAQMSATGKLMGQDLLQMINAGFNPLMTISEKTGKSIGELKKDMESGAISSEMVADAFASATEKGGKFYGMTQKQAEGIRGLQAQLDGGLQDAFNEIGKSQEGLINGGYKVATALVENYRLVGEALTALIATYGVYKAAMVFNTSIDKTVTVMRYEAEIAELTKLLPLKEQEANADLKSAVASGKLTQAKAEQLIALRAEIESRRESIQSKLAEEQANLKALYAKRAEAKETLEIARAKTAAAKEELANAIATAQADISSKQQKSLATAQETASLTRRNAILLNSQKIQLQSSIADMIAQAEIAKKNTLLLTQQQIQAQQAVADARELGIKGEKLALLKAEVTALNAKVTAAQREEKATINSIATKRAEIVAIDQKLVSAKAEALSAQRSVIAKEAEIAAGTQSVTTKQIETLTNKVNTLSEQENAAATTHNGLIKQTVAGKVLIKKIATDADTASSQINTAVTNANTVSTNVLTAAKTRLITVAKNLWAVLAPNPYILAAAAAVALGYGIYKLATYTTEAEKANARLNDAIKESEKASLAETRELAKLKGELSEVKKGTDEYNTIKEKIVQNYGKYYAGLEGEIDRVGLLDTTYRKLTESIQKSFSARQYTKFAQQESDNLDNVMSDNLGKIQDRLIDKLGDEAGAKYYTRIRKAILDGNLKANNAYKISGLDKETQDILDKVAGKGDIFQNRAVEGYIKDIIRAKELTDELDKKAKIRFGIDDTSSSDDNDKKESEKIKSYSDQVKEAKDNVSKLNNELSSLKKGIRPSNLKENEQFDFAKGIEDKTKALKDAQDKYSYLLNGKSYSNNNAGESKAKKATELANDEAELRKKLANEALQAELDYEQAVLEAKEGSYDKQFQLNDLNYRKELQKIKEYNDQKLKEQADFITKFGKKALPEELTDKSIKEQVAKKTNQAQYNYEAADSKTEKQRLEADQQAWNEYLKTYGDYEDKRLAIFNEYREKIGKAQTQGEKALLAGNRDKELQDLDQTLIEKSDLWVRLFDDASKHTTGYITETIKKVQQLIDYMKGVEGVEIPIGFTPEQIESLKKDPEKVKEILKGLKTQVDELNTRNPFNSIIQGFKDLKKAGKDTEKQYTATNKIISGIQGVREVVGQLSTAFTDLGMNSEDSLAKVMNVMDRTASMAQTGAQIGGAWGAAIGGAIGLTTSLISAFKGKSKAQKDTEQLQDVTSKIETTNNSINRLLEKRIDLINEATAAEAGYLNTLTQEQIKQQQTYVQSMFDRLSGNEIFGKKGKNNNLSLSALMQKEGLSSMEEFVEWWNSNGVNKLIGEGYDLKNEDQWQSIVDSWEELSEAAENAEKAMKEAVTGISFDSLKDSLDDLVKSADTTFEDIGDSFNDHMRNAALKFAKSSYLTKALQDWYDKFAEYAQSGSTDDSFGLTPEETAELRKMYEDAYNKAQGLYDSALDAMGISKEDSDINGITGVAASITQDSANELNGNFYAVRQSLNDVRNINKQTQEYIKVQTGHISDVKEAVSSYKQVFADQLTYIKMTAENTAATASILREIRDNGLIMKR